VGGSGRGGGRSHQTQTKQGDKPADGVTHGANMRDRSAGDDSFPVVTSELQPVGQ
jgi:hypothetical protein